MLTIDFVKMKIKGVSVKSLTMRELNGDDSEAAAARVVNANTNMVHGFLISRAHNEQCIADSIVEVDGSPVITPYVDWKKWNLRTREFVLNAYNRMNGATQTEMDDFFVQTGLADAAESASAGSR